MTQRDGAGTPRRGRKVVLPDGAIMFTIACQACSEEISPQAYADFLGPICITGGLIVRWWCGCDGATPVMMLSFDLPPPGAQIH